MAYPTPAELLVACYACQPSNLIEAMKVKLLSDILLILDPMADTDPASLLEAGACYACHPDHNLQVFQATLLADIANSLTSVGGFVPLHGNGDPNGVVAADAGWNYTQEDNPGAIWTKVVDDVGGDATLGWSVNT